mgnify:CR=1 FL=1
MNVIGRCNRNDGQKQKPENGCFTGFLASPARFERAAPRLGVWRAAWYIVRFIICLVVLSEIVLPGYWSICIKIPVMPPRDGVFRKSN